MTDKDFTGPSQPSPGTKLRYNHNDGRTIDVTYKGSRVSSLLGGIQVTVTDGTYTYLTAPDWLARKEG